MAISQFRAKRKKTGGRYKSIAKKVKNRGNLPLFVTIGELRKKIDRTRGGHLKKRLLQADMANVYDPKQKKYSKAKVISVIDNPGNRNFIRRNIMTKGCIIKTEKGDAKITSRPGQEGQINAVLIDKK